MFGRWGCRHVRGVLLLLLMAGFPACGGGPEATPVPSTVGELFDGSVATTTIGGLRVDGWIRRDLPDLQAAADRCAALADVDAPIEPEEGPRTVVVESGDSLGKIAKRFDRTIDQFMRANGMSDPNLLQIGQVLVVPAKRAEDVSEPDGPTVVIEPIFCEIDTGVSAFGPDGRQLGGPGILEVFGDWPRLEGPREAPRVNGRLRGLASASIRSFLDDAVEAIEKGGYACRDASHNRCAWLQHRPEVLLATDDLLSVRDVVRLLLPGSSMVDVEVRTSTFDLATGRTIAIDGLFDPDTDWLVAVSAAAIERLADQPWTDERRVVGAGPEAENFERFNLTYGGLVLSFAPGTIGGAGTEDVLVTIPYRILDGYWALGGPVAWLEDLTP
ncbi:MAG: hypothetical protein CL467_06300 [Acidimicrobiaceae bacterium]|nr:hypothetical protein [Acidimicrobiaceae bacterium]